VYKELKPSKLLLGLVLLIFLLNACVPATNPNPSPGTQVVEDLPFQEANIDNVTPVATRPLYPPGTMVEYLAQSGDTLPAVAQHFNSSIAEIRSANPIIPQDVTTLPPGFPMQIPIYYESIWSSAFQIIPDIAFVFGPRDVDFDPVSFVQGQPGWLKYERGTIGEKIRTGGEIVLYVSEMFSVSPKLLLAIVEYQTGALTQETKPDFLEAYPLNYQDPYHQGLAQQLIWLANFLNNNYYSWREGTLGSYKHSDGRLERPDPWQNAATAALQVYYSQIMDREGSTVAISEQGLLKTYVDLFGDPWQGDLTLIAGSIRQPEFILPFASGQTWAYTGGPHTAWGQGPPFAAIDLAPSSSVGGCSPSEYPALAIADGTIVRKGNAYIVLDLDGDNDEKTGWNIFYLHLANNSLPSVGTQLKQGDPIGMPSCEGGTATGTHVHIARKYNGEWVLAGGPLAFTMEGWKVGFGSAAYQGTLERNGVKLTACVCSDRNSQVTARGLK